MEDDTDLRMLVMKKSAGTPNGLYTASGEGQRSGGQPLIQAVGPDFSRLSRDLNRVVLKIQHQSEVSSDCPMHAQRSEEYFGGGGGQYSDRRRPLSSADLSDSRRGSRGHLAVTHRSSSAEIRNNGASRNNANPEHYMSLPRRLSSATHKSSSSASKVDRRQSFQDFKTFRDKFTGPLDFKNTLRGGQSQPQGGQKERGRKGRHYSEPRDAYGQTDERQRHFIESDFDFRSPPSTRDNSRERRTQYSRDYDGGRDYYAQDVTGPPQPRRGYTQHSSASKEPPRPRYGYHDLKAGAVTSPTESLRSPLGSSMRISVQGSQEMLSKDPLSPRRVEFADEVFNFQSRGTPATSRPGSRCESPNPKGILRHTISDPVSRAPASRGHTVELAPASRSVKEAVRSNTTDLSFCQPSPLIGGAGSRDPSLSLVETQEARTRPTSLSLNNQSLVKIMLPDDNHHDSDDPHHNDSDDTLIEEKHETESSKEVRPGDDEQQGQQKPKRTVPPQLADWNRSQSFPPAAGGKNSSAPGPENNLRKRENDESDEEELGDSSVSLLSTSSSNPGRGLRHHEDMDLIQGDNESLRVRVGDLERQVVDNNDEIKCLRGTLAECLRKIGEIEVKISSRRSPPRRRDLSEGSVKSNRKTHVMTNPGIYGSQDFTNRATFEIQNPPQRGTYAPRQR